MKLTKQQLSSLPDEGLLYYLQHDQDDEEQRSLAMLLEYAIADEDGIHAILDKLRIGATLGAAYNGAKVPSGGTIIGPIPDGTLYYIFQ